MLLFLTGDIQTGKTRWLTSEIERLQAQDVAVLGVIAPGVWHEHVCADGSSAYKKLGIDNILLPQGTRISFARRRDLVQQEEVYNQSSQSARMQLQWAIDDNAITTVNAHLRGLLYKIHNADLSCQKNMLVIDELGRLELLGGMGLTEAIRLLEAGPTKACAHALVVVREALIDVALEQIPSSYWGGAKVIHPDISGAEYLRTLYL